jgi:hypothetical protein
MGAFTDNELQYLLSDRRLARLATVGRTARRTSPRSGGATTPA